MYGIYDHIIGKGGRIFIQARTLAAIAVARLWFVEGARLRHCAHGGFNAVSQHQDRVFLGLRLGAGIPEIIGVGIGVVLQSLVVEVLDQHRAVMLRDRVEHSPRQAILLAHLDALAHVARDDAGALVRL